jgi:uncharacterized protein (DUF58 family)
LGGGSRDWIVFRFYIPYCSVRAFARTPGALAPITYIFSADGVTAQFENASNTAAWTLVKGASETANFILIKMQRGSFHLLPKKQITEDQATLVRRILRKHVPAKVHLLKLNRDLARRD